MSINSLSFKSPLTPSPPHKATTIKLPNRFFNPGIHHYNPNPETSELTTIKFFS